MAMRENTGLQIALILFVMITVALAVSTYVYWDSANQSQKKEEAAIATLTQRDQALDKANDEITELRKMLGYKITQQGGPELADMAKNYKTDMAQFGEGWDKEKNYRTLPDFFSKELVKVNSALAKATEDKATLVAQLDTARQQEATNTAEYRKQQEAANDDLAKVTVEYKTRREEAVGQQDLLQAKLEDLNKTSAADKIKKDKEMDKLHETIDRLDKQRNMVMEKLDLVQNKGTITEQPDGLVTWVSQEGGTVYVNLGSADSLRRSTTFTVYEAGTVNLGNAEPKASIEITTVRGPHLSEARIVEDSLSNPILSNDVVFSPVWNPGQKTHFALVGFMDVDGDGKSDRALIRSLIAQNGGEVDAEVLDDGTRKGKLSINTRYLVQGERANEKSSADALQASSTMLKEAEDLGVEKISVERLLSDMGWRGSERTVSAASGSSGGGFKPQPKATESPSGGAFERRTRPGATRRSGY
jgi:hypothetical protein